MSEIVIVVTGQTGPNATIGALLDDLSDVTITAAASGDVLRHNGTAWVDVPGTTYFEVAGAVAAHEADTTNVHGIADTSVLETTTGSASKVATHAALTSSVHGISAFGATLVDDADAATARSTLGLGSIATQAASSVAITGGSVAGITDLAVADGGTGASTAAGGLANLTSTTLAADGDILTRSGGSPAAITRANLAADTAFSSRYAPKSIVYLSGTSGNFISTPDAASLDITGNLELVCRAQKPAAGASSKILIAKVNNSSSQYSWSFEVYDTALYFIITTGGTSATQRFQIASITGLVDGTVYWWKATIDTTSTVMSLYYAADAPEEPSSWTTLVSGAVAGATSIYSGSAPVTVGANGDGVNRLTGKIGRAIVRDGIGGTVVADWRGDVPLGPRYRDTTGKVWTINGSDWSWMVA